MSEIQKVLNLIRGGGGSEVFKKFWNSKSSELSEGEGGGVKPNWEFFSDASPKQALKFVSVQ